MLYKIRVGWRKIEDFDPTTFETKDLRTGLTAVYARPKPAVLAEDDGALMLTAPAEVEQRDRCMCQLQFDSASFTLEKALEWVEKYGYKVDRLEFSLRWAAQAEQFSDVGAQAYVTREADLFQAGEYPDRGMTVTPADLEQLAATPGEVPINVEHIGGQWEKIGHVSGLRAAGNWLKGTMNLLPEADALFQKIGMKGVSVAVLKGLNKLHHVAVTGTPRVAGAGMFSGGDEGADCVVFALGEQPGGTTMPETPVNVSAEQFSELQSKFATLASTLEAEKAARVSAEEQVKAIAARASAVEFALRLKGAEQQAAQFIETGRVPPAAKDEAVALLLSDGVVKFSDGEKPVAQLFAAFCDKLPVHLANKPVKGAPVADPLASMSEEQRTLFAKHFSDLKPEDIAKFGGEV